MTLWQLSSEYPEVDGQNSIMCYLRALDNCYLRYKEAVFKRVRPLLRCLSSQWFLIFFLFVVLSAKLDRMQENVRFDFRKAEFAVFHAPFNKLVQKSVARLVRLSLSSLL